MSIVLAVIVAIATTGLAAVAWFADMMSDAPAVKPLRVVPILAWGYGIAALLVASHFIGW